MVAKGDLNQKAWMFGECCICDQSVSNGVFVSGSWRNGPDWACIVVWVGAQLWRSIQPEKVLKGITVVDAFKSLTEKLLTFKTHCFVKVKQATAFHQLYTAPASQCAVLQTDFSENALIVQQDEVQGAHLYHPQVTLLTALAWTMRRTPSFVGVSDSLVHDKYTAAAICSVKSSASCNRARHHQSHVLACFPDGAAQHFRQKFMLAFKVQRTGSQGLSSTHTWHAQLLWVRCCGKYFWAAGKAPHSIGSNCQQLGDVTNTDNGIDLLQARGYQGRRLCWG